MGSALTAEGFTRLLACFDTDRERAGERYEELRRTLIKFFEWRRAPFPEDHTDETFNRVGRRLAEGIEINNINGYCYEVARLVCLEAWKGNDSKREPLKTSFQPAASANTTDLALERELRLDCLDQCLNRLPAESQTLIVEYYEDEKRNRIERREALAKALGLRRDALANRAQRLRDKLEQCVTRCCDGKIAI